MPIKRDDIMHVLQLTLQGILNEIDNGYYTNLGKNVHLWRIEPYDARELPAINIVDEEDLIDSEQFRGPDNQWSHRLLTRLEIVCAEGDLSRPLMRQYVADVYRALGKDYTLGGLTLDVVALGDRVMYDKEETIAIGVEIRLELRYRTARFSDN